MTRTPRWEPSSPAPASAPDPAQSDDAARPAARKTLGPAAAGPVVADHLAVSGPGPRGVVDAPPTKSQAMPAASDWRDLNEVSAERAHVARVGTGSSRALSPAETYRRTQVVLDHFGVPSVSDGQAQVNGLARVLSAARLKDRLAVVDPQNELFHYANIVTLPGGGQALQAFKDRDSKKILDFEIPLAAQGSAPDITSSSACARLLNAKDNPGKTPLAGLTIALDAGHFSGPDWAAHTGKYIEAGGKTVYEGNITLQTVQLLAKQLEALGAKVVLTRQGGGTVTTDTHDSLDLQAYARKEIERQSSSHWFVDLVTKAKNDADLLRLFDAAREVKEIFSDEKRWDYLIDRGDLQARADLLNHLEPDITVVVHYDTGESHALTPSVPDATKVYVYGSPLNGELAHTQDRVELMHHLLDPYGWRASAELSKALVEQIGQTIQVPPEPAHSGETDVVSPGVLTRNLKLNRTVTHSITAYVEGFFYSRPEEFDALTDPKRTVVIDGESYPQRIEQMAEALKKGIVQFVKTYDGAP